MKKELLSKKVFYAILIGYIVTSICPVLAMNQKDETGILIRPIRPITPGTPHAPAYNPFSAELMNGFVVLSCSSSFGIVDVSLTSTAGDNYSTVFDTADGTIIIPISGSTGEYTILITTSSDLEYVGEFVI